MRQYKGATEDGVNALGLPLGKIFANGSNKPAHLILKRVRSRRLVANPQYNFKQPFILSWLSLRGRSASTGKNWKGQGGVEGGE